MKRMVGVVFFLFIAGLIYAFVSSQRRQMLDNSYNCEINGYTCSHMARCWGHNCNPSLKDMIGIEPVKTEVRTPEFVEYRLTDGKILKTPFMIIHGTVTNKTPFLTVIYPNGNIQKFNRKGHLIN